MANISQTRARFNICKRRHTQIDFEQRSELLGAALPLEMMEL